MQNIHLLAMTLHPSAADDAERLGRGLAQLMSEDAQLQVRIDQATGSVVLRGMSERHLDHTVSRLYRDFHVNALLSRPHVITRATVARTVDGQAKYAKQVQGRGYYGHVKLRLHPVVPGSGHIVEKTFPAGSIPDEFVAAVETGITESLTAGEGIGHPIHDARVEVWDGSYHDVDSTEAAFRAAASLAVRDALGKAEVLLTEPMMRVHVVLPVQYHADVVKSFVSRGGEILSDEDRGATRAIEARSRLADLFGYEVGLGMHTAGGARATIALDSFVPVRGSEKDDNPVAGVRVPLTPRPTLSGWTSVTPQPDSSIE